MKKFLPFLSILFIAAACNTSPKDIAGQVTEPVQESLQDTAGLAQYREWKAQNELTVISEMVEPASEPARPAVKQASRPAAAAPVKKAAPAKTTVKNTPSNPTPPPVTGNTGTGSLPSTEGAGSGSGSGSGEVATTGGSSEAADQKKGGISNAAKGAVIGGTAGATAGAVINKKNRTAGAVIGAVVGAAGGYVIGRKMDQKE